MSIELEIPALYIINSPQGGGKSHLIRYLMYINRKKFDYGLVFSNTFFDGDSFDYVKKEYVHPEYNEEALQKLMDIQQELISKNIIKEAYVIFDDCIEKEQFSSETLKQLTIQLRHFHITLIFATQYANLVPTRMRSNCMGTFIFATDSECNLKALYASYGQQFNNYQDFKNYLIKNTGNHKFLYYSKKHTSDDLCSTYRVMICPAKIPKFKLKIKSSIN